MKVLLACEESQIVTKQFRLLGHEAYSNDIIETTGNYPEWHIKDDVNNLLSHDWDLIIGFPPCTYLTVSGNRWFNVERYGEKALKRIADREKAVELFMNIANSKAKHIAIENPVGYMNTHFRKPDQIIQPQQFGDPYEKRTCLWLKNLSTLKETEIVRPEERTYFSSGKSHPTWYANALKYNSDERSKIRSKTFPGIAKAMSEQWSDYLKEEIKCTN